MVDGHQRKKSRKKRKLAVKICEKTKKALEEKRRLLISN